MYSADSLPASTPSALEASTVMGSGTVSSGGTSSSAMESAKTALASLPAASTAVNVSSVVPAANSAGTSTATATSPSTTSLAVIEPSHSWICSSSAVITMSGSVDWIPKSSPAISGAVVSSTVMVTTAEPLLPPLSVATTGNSVTPSGNAAGNSAPSSTVTTVSTLSVPAASARRSASLRLAPSALVASNVIAPPVKTGAAWSSTITVTSPVALLPLESVAVIATSVLPIGKTAGTSASTSTSPSTKSTAPT